MVLLFERSVIQIPTVNSTLDIKHLIRGSSKLRIPNKYSRDLTKDVKKCEFTDTTLFCFNTTLFWGRGQSLYIKG